MTKIGIILGSTRPGRVGEAVARWVHQVAAQRADAEFELVDLLDFKLRSQVALSLFTDFENFSVFKPGEHQLPYLHTTLDQVAAWSEARAPLCAA